MKYETKLEDYELLRYFINNKEYKSDNYKVNTKTGCLINKNNLVLKTKAPKKIYHRVGISGDHKIHQFVLHRLIYEHVHGKIEGNYDVDHIDDNPDNNSISNLQLLTHRDNLIKSVKNRDYAFIKNNQRNRHVVKAINLTTKEQTVYKSLYAVAKDLNINAGLVKLVADQKCRSAISKNDNQAYTFTYTDEKPTKQVTRALTLYQTEEERKQAKKEQIQKYTMKRKFCLCGKSYYLSGKSSHFHTTHHKRFEEKEQRYIQLIKRGNDLISKLSKIF